MSIFCTLPGLFMMVSGGVVGAGSGGTGELTARKAGLEKPECRFYFFLKYS
jgi:hypothetical protein